MRLGSVILVILCCVLLLPYDAGAAEQVFPYTAYVTQDEAYVRSGAGRNFYATAQLKRGEKVEVHAREAGGWLAIRPPEGSFSWVPGERLKVGDDGIALVLEDGVASHIGSSLEEHRDVIQVRLERGEEVEVLDAVRVGEGEEAEWWYKIAPPSGEFRYLEERYLSRERPYTLPEPSAQPSADKREPYRPLANHRRANTKAEINHGWVPSLDRATAGGLKFARRDTHPGSTSTARPADEMQHRDEKSTGTTGASGPHSSAANSGESGSGGKFIAGPSGADDGSASVSDLLNAINLELSQMVVDDPGRWQFGELQKRCQSLVGRAQSADERSRLAALQNRINKFEEIRQRSLQAAGTSPARLDSPSIAAVASAGGEAIDLDRMLTSGSVTPPTVKLEDPSRYDGVGKLTRVVSQRPNAPRYALINSSNEVVSFVSPSAGVNLQPYEGQYVGVSGQRGFMPELKKPHVTALRVSPVEIGALERTRR